VKLAVDRRGQGFPVLCLHGHPGTGQTMAVFTESLSQRCFTLAPDLRGYGASRTGQPFAMIDHLADLTELLNAHNIQRCLVLGWSLGGILAMELALRSPQLISGLILVATAARPRSQYPKTTWQTEVNTAIAAGLNAIHPGWPWAVKTFGLRSHLAYLMQQHTPAAYQRLTREGVPAFLRTSRPASRALRQALGQGYNRLGDLNQIQVPCLMLYGECDRHIIPATSQETAAQLPNCHTIAYPNTAHLFPWEVPQQVQADIDQWLLAHPEVILT
jgi:pimeloyl-ACP methyl ester carboxylesterase